MKSEPSTDDHYPPTPLIVYEYRPGHIYLNITNRCTNSCCFCSVKTNHGWLGSYNLNLSGAGHSPCRVHPNALRVPSESKGMTRELAGQHPVAKNSFQSMLDAEPSADAILACLESLCAKTRPYPIKEFVFCGAGEPLVRLDVVVTVSQWLKSRDFKVRINTNGHALLMHGSAAVETIQEITDAISISLNAHNRTIYNRISNPAAQEASYPSLLVFAEQCAKSIPEVTLSAVSLRPKEKAAIRDSIDLDACAKISEAIGVRFRIR